MEEIRQLPINIDPFINVSNIYIVSNYGYVLNTKNNKKYTCGSINLWNGNGYLKMSIKEIIMLTFSYRPDYSNHKIINLNFDINDNRLDNLVWDDYTRFGMNVLTLPIHEFNDMNEKWLPIFNYGYMSDVNVYGYYVSTFGNIYSAATKRYNIGVVNRYGYYFVNLYSLENPTKRKCKLVHRIVMNTFKYNPDYNNLQINHIDGNKLNNNINNLEWCTSQYNSIHAIKTGLMHVFGEDNYNNIYSIEFTYFVLDKYLEGYSGREIISLSMLDQRFNYKDILDQTISNIVRCSARQKEICQYLIEHAYTLSNLFANKQLVIDTCRTFNNRFDVLNALKVEKHSPKELAVNLTYYILKNKSFQWINYLDY